MIKVVFWESEQQANIEVDGKHIGCVWGHEFIRWHKGRSHQYEIWLNDGKTLTGIIYCDAVESIK